MRFYSTVLSFALSDEAATPSTSHATAQINANGSTHADDESASLSHLPGKAPEIHFKTYAHCGVSTTSPLRTAFKNVSTGAINISDKILRNNEATNKVIPSNPSKYSSIGTNPCKASIAAVPVIEQQTTADII